MLSYVCHRTPALCAGNYLISALGFCDIHLSASPHPSSLFPSPLLSLSLSRSEHHPFQPRLFQKAALWHLSPSLTSIPWCTQNQLSKAYISLASPKHRIARFLLSPLCVGPAMFSRPTPQTLIPSLQGCHHLWLCPWVLPCLLSFRPQIQLTGFFFFLDVALSLGTFLLPQI